MHFIVVYMGEANKASSPGDMANVDATVKHVKKPQKI